MSDWWKFLCPEGNLTVWPPAEEGAQRGQQSPWGDSRSDTAESWSANVWVNGRQWESLSDGKNGLHKSLPFHLCAGSNPKVIDRSSVVTDTDISYPAMALSIRRVRCSAPLPIAIPLFLGRNHSVRLEDVRCRVTVWLPVCPRRTDRVSTFCRPKTITLLSSLHPPLCTHRNTDLINVSMWQLTSGQTHGAELGHLVDVSGDAEFEIWLEITIWILLGVLSLFSYWAHEIARVDFSILFAGITTLLNFDNFSDTFVLLLLKCEHKNLYFLPLTFSIVLFVFTYCIIARHLTPFQPVNAVQCKQT